jgi:hypothetical protein
MLTPLASAPVKSSRNRAAKFAATVQPLNDLCKNMDSEMLCKNTDSEMRKDFVGPMPVRSFLDDFLPVVVPSELRGRLPDFNFMARRRSKRRMYSAFVCPFFCPPAQCTPLIVRAQVEVANSICKTIRAYNNSIVHFTEEDSEYKPDIAFYDVNARNFDSPLASFQKMEMFVEFNRGYISDPFHSHDQLPFEKLFENYCKTCGRIVLFSTRLQNYQFRTWAFSVGIFGETARLFRWDRAGAIVSEPIPYYESENHDLAEFLYRFDQMNHSQRGLDPTVFDATPQEAAVFDGAIKTVVGEGKNMLLKLFDSVGKEDDYPRRRIEIPASGDRDGRVVSYVVGRSIANMRSPFGRGTRCFVAISQDTGKLVFLKDSWRLDVEGTKGEAHLFGKLHGAKNVSTFLHGSDIRCVAVRRVAVGASGPPTNPSQHTLTNLYSNDFDGPQRMMMGYIHYRTVHCEFYVPLEMFVDSKHLTQILLDIIIGTNLRLLQRFSSFNLPQRYSTCTSGGSSIETLVPRTL